MLTAALLPLRPLRMFGLGALLLAASCLGTVFMGIPLHADLVETVGAATVVAVSVVTAARSTSQRIRVHHAHACAMKAERQAKAARERALLAESAISMERLAASLSHELNTPIGVLKSATQTLVRSVEKHSGFGDGRRSTAQILEDLANAIANSTARLTEIVARIQRFANLDRSAVSLVDLNQLVQDAVALMNPPSANQTRIKLRLEPLPAIWCRPHALSVAVASILNKLLGSTLPITIDTYAEKEKIIVRITRFRAATELIAASDLCFSVVDGRVRASGWDLFAARQLVQENGGILRVEGSETGEQVVLISIPADPHLTAQDHQCA
jgi:signal transduction histidine kinase